MLQFGNILLMSKKEIGELIQKRRTFLYLKQEDLAEMSQISPKSIYLLEQGKGNPSIDTLNKIFEVLGLEFLIRIKILDV